MLSSKRCPNMSNRLELMREKFQKGQVLGREDFEVAGFDQSKITNALAILKKEYALDILVLCRGKVLVGWILADEVL